MYIHIDDHNDLPQPEPNERSLTCKDCGGSVSLNQFFEMACCLCERCYEGLFLDWDDWAEFELWSDEFSDSSFEECFELWFFLDRSIPEPIPF